MNKPSWLHAVVAGLTLFACGGAAGVDGGLTSALDGAVASFPPLADGGLRYPTWELEDVQPQSARANETYGLSVFAGRPLVVVLLEGY